MIIVLVVIQFIWNINDSRQIKANRFIKDIQAKVIIGEAVILPCYYHKEDIKPTYIDFLFKKAKDLITIRIIDKETISFCFTWSSPEPEKYCEIIYKSNDEFDSDYLIPEFQSRRNLCRIYGKNFIRWTRQEQENTAEAV